MLQDIFQVKYFKQQLRDSLRSETLNASAITIAKNDYVYTTGNKDETIYFIESGQVKLFTLSPAGKECLLDILTAGNIFGELCLSGAAPRMETAMVIEETVLKRIPRSRFLACLSRNSLFEGFVQYMAERIADQQQMITNLVTVDSEQRLARMLLQLAHKLGRKDPRIIRIELKITHEELAEMVGTTRSRISMLMQRFRNLGLLEITEEHFLVIREHKLLDYLTQISEPQENSFQIRSVLKNSPPRFSRSLNEMQVGVG